MDVRALRPLLWRTSWLAVGIALAAWLVMTWLLPPGVFWITDEGNRWLQLEALARTGAPDVGRLWGGWQADPDGAYFPTAGHHFLRQGQRVVSFYPPYLPLLTWPVHTALGDAGLSFWPLLGLLGTVALFPWLLVVLGMRSGLLLASMLPLVASPLLFYSAGFWEQPLAAALGCAAMIPLLYALRDDRVSLAWLGGALLGAASWMREEGYVFAAAWGAAIVVAGWREKRRAGRGIVAVGIGFLTTAIPLWWLQTRLWGSPFGIHALVYDRLERAHSLRGELGDAFSYLLEFGDGRWLRAAMLLLFGPLLLVGLLPTRRAAGWRPWALGMAAVGSVVAIVGLVLDPEPVLGTLQRQGLLPHAPILGLTVLSLRRRAADPDLGRRTLVWSVLLYALGLVWLLHRSAVGVIWGPRHFLPAVPALLAWCALELEEERTEVPRSRGDRFRRIMIAVLLSSSLMQQLLGLYLLGIKREAGDLLLAAVRGAPARAVVSDRFWLPEELATLWGEKTFFAVDDDRGLEKLLDRLHASGESEALVLLSVGGGPVSDAERERLARSAVAWRRVGRRGVSFLAVDGFLVRLPVPGTTGGG